MASMAERSYTGLFSQQQRHDDFNSYPDPPQNPFASASPMDLSVTYPATTSVGFVEPSLCPETPSYILTGHTSPVVYADDIDMRLPSSGLSATSVPSAPSSTAGSPQSHHGRLGLSDWNNSSSSSNTTSLHPNIVGSDYIHGSDYFPTVGMEDFTSFDFGVQPKNFV
ncbi:hypothetical protein E4U41_007258, partial [Claviceps citrina]